MHLGPVLALKAVKVLASLSIHRAGERLLKVKAAFWLLGSSYTTVREKASRFSPLRPTAWSAAPGTMLPKEPGLTVSWPHWLCRSETLISSGQPSALTM